MAHTPGPWNEHEGFITGRFKSDNEIHDICDPRCAPVDADTICEMDANARLIAAAPELLDALQLLFEDWKTLVGEDLKENNSDVLNLWNKTIAAITKATGEQP